MNTKLGIAQYVDSETDKVSCVSMADTLRFTDDSGSFDIPHEKRWDFMDQIFLKGNLFYKKKDGGKSSTLYLVLTNDSKVKKFDFYESIKAKEGIFVLRKYRVEMKRTKTDIQFVHKNPFELSINLHTGLIYHEDLSKQGSRFAIEMFERFKNSANTKYSPHIRNFFGAGLNAFNYFSLLKNVFLHDKTMDFLGSTFENKYNSRVEPSKDFVLFIFLMKNLNFSVLEKFINSDMYRKDRIIRRNYNVVNHDYSSYCIYYYENDFYFPSFIDQSKDKLHEMLNMPKFFLPYFKEYMVDLERIKGISDLSKLISNNLVKELLEIAKDEIDIHTFVNNTTIFTELISEYGYTNPKKLFIYLARDLRMRQGIEGFATACTYLRDYNRMSVDMDRQREKYPKSLKRDHDLLSMNYRVFLDHNKGNFFKDAVMKEDYLALKREIKEEFYCIVTPTKFEDLVSEGVHLSHCIASYTNSVIQGQCKIVFLRRTKAKDQPLISIEIRGNSIRQISGYENRKPDSYEMEFIKLWAKDQNLFVRIY